MKSQVQTNPHVHSHVHVHTCMCVRISEFAGPILDCTKTNIDCTGCGCGSEEMTDSTNAMLQGMGISAPPLHVTQIEHWKNSTTDMKHSCNTTRNTATTWIMTNQEKAGKLLWLRRESCYGYILTYKANRQFHFR